MPIPKPTQLGPKDDYKLSLAMDHYRFHTAWLKVIDSKTQFYPMLEVTLRRAGESLRGTKVKVVPMPAAYANMHKDAVDSFSNPSEWPKHLIVRYRWEEEVLISVSFGLSVVSMVGVILSGYLIVSVVMSSKTKLLMFAHKVTAGGGVGFDAGSPKAE